MKKALCASLRQAILSRAFLISTLGAAFIPLLSSVQGILSAFRSAELLSPGYHSDLIMGALSSEAMALALPILAALPYTAAPTTMGSATSDTETGPNRMKLPSSCKMTISAVKSARPARRRVFP